VLIGFTASTQTDTTTYHLTLKQELVNVAGKNVTGITNNGSIIKNADFDTAKKGFAKNEFYS